MSGKEEEVVALSWREGGSGSAGRAGQSLETLQSVASGRRVQWVGVFAEVDMRQMKVRSYPGKAVEAMGLSYEANWEGLRNPFRQEPLSVGSTAASSFEYHANPRNESRNPSPTSQSPSISSRDLQPSSFRGKSVSFEDEREEEFSIPRPKLIVPVHTYGIRKRRTGMVLQSGRSGSGDGSDSRHKQLKTTQLQQYTPHHNAPHYRQQHRSCPGIPTQIYDRLR